MRNTFCSLNSQSYPCPDGDLCFNWVCSESSEKVLKLRPAVVKMKRAVERNTALESRTSLRAKIWEKVAATLLGTNIFQVQIPK